MSHRRLRLHCIGLQIALAFLALAATRAVAVPVEPTEIEQYMLELINRARANPAAEAQRFNIDLNEGLPAGTITATPKQPMAFNFNLVDSARDHSQWMIDNDMFQHEGPGQNDGPAVRAKTAGYNPPATFFIGENLGWKGTTPNIPDPYTTTAELHEGLFVDEGIENRGHRTNMMHAEFQEAGVGIVSGIFRDKNNTNYNAVMITTDFAYWAQNSFLTGVVYKDFDSNQFYTPNGEGYDSIAIRAINTATGATFETTTFGTGGYSLQVPPGKYDVSFGGGSLLSTIYLDVSIGTQNLKLDLIDSPSLRPWSNSQNRFDADINGFIEPHDVLVLIDELNRFGIRSLAAPPTSTPSVYLDVNRDAFFSPADILQAIDAVNRRPLGGFSQSQSAGGVLSFFETSESIIVPEPQGAALAILAAASLLRCARHRGTRRRSKATDEHLAAR
jgi:uncharacterized protein YkwD